MLSANATELANMARSLTLPIVVFGVGCAGLMGFAIQRGSTCLVAAIDELISERRGTRLTAIVEASLWVASGLLVARLIGVVVNVEPPATTPGWAIAGGILFGIGACINGACAFGTVARLGSREWAYAFTPLGMLVGDVGLNHLRHTMAAAMSAASPEIVARTWLLVPVVGLVAWRAIGVGGSLVARPVVPRPSTAHLATIVIGVTFLAMFLTAGPWAYTDILAELARGAGSNRDARWLLVIALFAGAFVAGWRGRRRTSKRPDLRTALRCTTGGILMGWGSALIPGGNDGLLLIGMPLLRPCAWIAASAMAMTIVAALLIARGARWNAPAAK